MTRHWLCEGTGPFRPADALPLTDRGFRYGMAVFETLRVRRGRIEFLGEHLWRLARACRESAFPVHGRTLREAARILSQFARADPLWAGVARMHVTAGDGGPADAPASCRLLVSLEPRELPPADLYRVGLRLRVHPTPHHPLFGGRKTHNYWMNLEALRGARLAGAEEALLADAGGRLITVCMGNVFLLSNGQLSTPKAKRGARSGVMRAQLLRLTGAKVRDLSSEEWQAPDAAFLVTNSWLGVVPGFRQGTDVPNSAVRDVVEIARAVNERGPS